MTQPKDSTEALALSQKCQDKLTLIAGLEHGTDAHGQAIADLKALKTAYKELTGAAWKGTKPADSSTSKSSAASADQDGLSKR